MPTKYHEEKIDYWCDQGYIRYRFVLFVKFSFMCSCEYFTGNRKEYLKKAFYICGLDRYQQKAKALEHEIISLIDFDQANHDEEGDYIPAFDNRFDFDFGSPYQYKVIPDCWRYNENTNSIDVVEVSDSSKVNWNKLSFYGLYDDCLFYYGGGMRLNLYEDFLKEDSLVAHQVVLAFESCFDGGEYHFDELKDDQKPDSYYYRKYAKTLHHLNSQNILI